MALVRPAGFKRLPIMDFLLYGVIPPRNPQCGFTETQYKAILEELGPMKPDIDAFENGPVEIRESLRDHARAIMVVLQEALVTKNLSEVKHSQLSKVLSEIEHSISRLRTSDSPSQERDRIRIIDNDIRVMFTVITAPDTGTYIDVDEGDLHMSPSRGSPPPPLPARGRFASAGAHPSASALHRQFPTTDVEGRGGNPWAAPPRRSPPPIPTRTPSRGSPPPIPTRGRFASAGPNPYAGVGPVRPKQDHYFLDQQFPTTDVEGAGGNPWAAPLVRETQTLDRRFRHLGGAEASPLPPRYSELFDDYDEQPDALGRRFLHVGGAEASPLPPPYGDLDDDYDEQPDVSASSSGGSQGKKRKGIKLFKSKTLTLPRKVKKLGSKISTALRPGRGKGSGTDSSGSLSGRESPALGRRSPRDDSAEFGSRRDHGLYNFRAVRDQLDDIERDD